jgi:hypothetical protein
MNIGCIRNIVLLLIKLNVLRDVSPDTANALIIDYIKIKYNQYSKG